MQNDVGNKGNRVLIISVITLIGIILLSGFLLFGKQIFAGKAINTQLLATNLNTNLISCTSNCDNNYNQCVAACPITNDQYNSRYICLANCANNKNNCMVKCPEINCTDKLDNDFDSKIDCYDTDCSNQSECKLNVIPSQINTGYISDSYYSLPTTSNSNVSTNYGYNMDSYYNLDVSNYEVRKDLVNGNQIETCTVNNTEMVYLLSILKAHLQNCGINGGKPCDYSNMGIYVCQNGKVFTQLGKIC